MSVRLESTGDGNGLSFSHAAHAITFVWWTPCFRAIDSMLHWAGPSYLVFVPRALSVFRAPLWLINWLILHFFSFLLKKITYLCKKRYNSKMENFMKKQFYAMNNNSNKQRRNWTISTYWFEIFFWFLMNNALWKW